MTRHDFIVAFASTALVSVASGQLSLEEGFKAPPHGARMLYEVTR